MAMPRRARAGGSLRSAMRLRAPRGSPTASARAAEATRESTSGRIPSMRGAARGDRADSSVLSCAASASDHVPEANPTSSSNSGIKPNFSLTTADAQAIVTRIEPGLRITGISELHGGEISRVYEIRFAREAPSLIVKIYPDVFQWKLSKEVS